MVCRAVSCGVVRCGVGWGLMRCGAATSAVCSRFASPVCLASLRFALLCSAPLCFALPCFALPCLALACFVALAVQPVGNAM